MMMLGIGGNESNVLSVTDFDALHAALSDVIAASGGSFIPCPSTGVNLTIEFNESVSIEAADPGTIDGTSVTINADDLEDNPTTFVIVLNVCDLTVGDFIVLSTNYTDDQSNDPDLSDLINIQIGDDITFLITPAPSTTVAPAPSATVPPAPTAVPTPAPTAMPTPGPTAMITPSPSIIFDPPTFMPTMTPSLLPPTMAPTAAPTWTFYSIP